MKGPGQFSSSGEGCQSVIQLLCLVRRLPIWTTVRNINTYTWKQMYNIRFQTQISLHNMILPPWPVRHPAWMLIKWWYDPRCKQQKRYKFDLEWRTRSVHSVHIANHWYNSRYKSDLECCTHNTLLLQLKDTMPEYKHDLEWYTQHVADCWYNSDWANLLVRHLPISCHATQ